MTALVWGALRDVSTQATSPGPQLPLVDLRRSNLAALSLMLWCWACPCSFCQSCIASAGHDGSALTTAVVLMVRIGRAWHDATMLDLRDLKAHGVVDLVNELRQVAGLALGLASCVQARPVVLLVRVM
nr:hypothetical protein [uncultured Pseudacidovorax sp.]